MKRKDRIKKKFLAKQARRNTTQQESQNEDSNKPKKESKSIYYTHYKTLLIIPFVILLIAIAIIVVQTARTGDFINKGIDLKGGVEITVPTNNLTPDLIKSQLIQAFPQKDFQVNRLENSGEEVAITVNANILPDENETMTAFVSKLEEITGVKKSTMNTNEIGAALGDAFFKQTMIAVLIAFIFMGLIVFFYFKSPAPSAAVILAAFSDIVITIAVVDLLGIKIGTGGIAALLMLIGYSVDTDILLSTRVLRNKEGTVYHRVINSMKTGLTMTLTTMAAVIVALIFGESEILREIMTIILIGLFADVINTWIQNAGIIRWWKEKQDAKEASSN